MCRHFFVRTHSQGFLGERILLCRGPQPKKRGQMSIVRYPKFDRFCRFIGALERARKGTEASSEREAVKQGRQRFVQALRDAGLGELTPDDIQELNTHKAEAD